MPKLIKRKRKRAKELAKAAADRAANSGEVLNERQLFKMYLQSAKASEARSRGNTKKEARHSKKMYKAASKA